MKQIFVLISVLLALVSGCGGSTTSVNQTELQSAHPIVALPQESGELGGQTLHSASGIPTGVRIIWMSIDDSLDAGSRVSGYHIYRSSNSIPDSALSTGSLWVNVGGDTLIGQAATPGNQIIIDDFFPVNTGETWFYRLSSVAEDGDESALSPELAVVISPFAIDALLTTTAGVGESVQIQGRNFGVHDPANDKVMVPGVLWSQGVGFNPVILEASITNWSFTLITATVPLGATAGKIQVIIDGVTVNTPEDFENSDPYITGVDRLGATMLDPITITGRNFGDVPDPSHRAVYGGIEILGAEGYDSYSDTALTLKPPNLQDFSQHSLLVKVGEVDSNKAYIDLQNAPPDAILNADQIAGTAPLSLRFNASGSFDPENSNKPNNGIVTYHWDFDGDGIFNESNNGESKSAGSSQPRQTYGIPGEYHPAVRVFDEKFLIDAASIQIDVGIPPVPQIADDTLQTDPHMNVDNTGNPDYTINLFYGLTDGLAPYQVEVDADFVDLVPSDPFAAFGLNDPAQVYTTDSSPFGAPLQNITDSVTVTQGVKGKYSFALRVTDSLGRMAVLVYPKEVRFFPPFNVAVIQDTDGDPAVPSVSAGIAQSLINIGYTAQVFNSDVITLAGLAAFDACVWASDGARGTAGIPFQWLSAQDLTLIRQFENTGRSNIILSPPADSRSVGIFADGSFEANYQPFPAVRALATATVDISLFPIDYTASEPTSLMGFTYNGGYGDTDLNPLVNPVTGHVEWNDSGTLEPVAALRDGPNGGNLYFGLFSVPSITGYNPADKVLDNLLDNIVSGTIVSLYP